MTSPSVYVIILNWKNAADTIECLKSLQKCSYQNKKILLLDNNSQDGSIEDVSEFLLSFDKNDTSIKFYDEDEINNLPKDIPFQSQYTVIRNFDNYGFAKGNNQVMKKIANIDGQNLIWLLNNDSIVESQTLQYLVKSVMQDNSIGMAASVIAYYTKPQIIHNLGAKYFSWLGMSKMYKKNKSINILNSLDDKKIETNIDYLSGASLLIKTQLLRDVGFFDERFFLYSEEQDLILRAKKGGWRMVISKKSFVYHKVAESTKNDRSSYHFMINKSNIIFLRKHFSIFNLLSSIFFINMRATLSYYSLKDIKAINKGIYEGLLTKITKKNN